ncbi:sensor domain-containing diguanylate cyclase [Roseateles sp. YR242]|uniref:sensor domain-containing diguanylate cyclase n=1 Tax=Roseateles sp. YR242 TaxID=1855305 RepID=UPI002100C7D3|nr:sensor domain-containing diguanylate cyclase [Roseateles sp. YR242]
MPNPDALLRIIDLHAQVAQLGLDLAGVMSLAVNGTLSLVHADGAAIEMAEGDELVYRAVAGSAANQLGARVSRDKSLSGVCLKRGVPLICDDADADPRVDQRACRRVGLRSMVVLPLMHMGSPVGVLKAYAHQPGRFGRDDIDVLELLAKLMAATMYWATRYGRDDLFHRATHDELTGLANRSLFMDRARHSIAEAERGMPAVAVLLLDMDGLKTINDTLGHAAGDAALIEFSRRLSVATRDSDTVARLGGDEFAVLLGRVETREALALTVERLQGAVDGTMVLNGQTVPLRGSAGGARYPEDGMEATLLVEVADRRMYSAKRRRKAEQPAPAWPPAAADALDGRWSSMH